MEQQIIKGQKKRDDADKTEKVGLKKEPKSATSMINQSPKVPEEGVRRSSRSTKGINRKYGRRTGG